MDSKTFKRKADEDLDTQIAPPNKITTNKEIQHNRENATLLIRNLPPNANVNKIKKFFKGYGEIKNVDHIKSLMVAKIEFTTHCEALIGLTRTLKKFNDNVVTVKWYNSNCTLWCTNYPPNYTLQNLKQLFTQFGGTVLSIRTPSLRYNSNRRFAYIDMLEEEQAIECLTKLNGFRIENYTLVVKKSDTSNKSKRTDTALRDGREIIISNIQTDIDKEQLLNHILDVAHIETDAIETYTFPPTTPNIAFITFKDKNTADIISKLHQIDFAQNKIYIKRADKKAYLERQKIKKILNTRRNNPLYDKIIKLSPINDKTSKEKLKSMIISNSSIKAEDIDNIFLVADQGFTLIIFKESKVAAKFMLGFNNKKINRSTMVCNYL
ncbi:U6 snRNP complex subunit PRP24 SCDLUD_001283 [Saccharomycodes ludwigii]|uniref:U6 snRNP complex subunit PRP24 n=1 Tax=Saccharomycodes ludwigii TaxID=36035 RepID=UPI001E82FC69|nr:hypothetical protein SCDLUD_001283 [Saccharomycodes ludwigii]KAH3903638.1 hypothetical protein SCDLUD_001283 [Saccharomycodes ludwigii]